MFLISAVSGQEDAAAFSLCAMFLFFVFVLLQLVAQALAHSDDKV